MTEYTYSTSADAQAESMGITKEPKAPEGTLLRQVQDAKESISVLKNQVSFANQCLSLLRNQMKHASDTLNILQDQVDLAQRTVSSLTEGSAAGLAIPQPHSTVAPPAAASRPQSSWGPAPAGSSDEQRVIVHDSEGPKVYTLSKSSISLGNQVAITSDGATTNEHGQVPCMVHQVPVHCHCPACLSHANVHRVPQSLHSPCHAPAGTATVQMSPEMPPPPRQAISVVVTEAANLQTSVPHSSGTSKGVSSHEHSKDSSSDERRSVKKESASTSPMAHQLLQVIDVLQTVDDDDGSTHRSPSASLSSLSHGVRVDYATIGNHRNDPYGSASVSLHKISRRNRKQTMSPAKVVSSESLMTTSRDKNSPVKTVIREHSELMRVPAPVLASSLEPEFLVVPSSSFSYDSPPTSASDRRGKEEDGKEEVKASSGIVLADRVVSSSCSRQETTGSVPVSTAARPNLSVESQESARGSSYKRRLSDDKSQPSGNVGDSRAHMLLSTIPEQNQRNDIPVDNNGFSSPLSPKRKFIGTSPLNSDIGMPFTTHSSPCGKTEPIVTTALNNSAAEPVSLATVVSKLEHSSSLPTSSHVTGSQAPPMAVISLPNNVESSSNPQKITSPTKKPIILSRRSSRSSEQQNIPQGLVVLVPTIEDAKRLIASTGGSSDGHTPVLVPQHMLNEIHSKNTVAEDERETQRHILRKRGHDVVSPPLPPQSKRSAVDSVVID